MTELSKRIRELRRNANMTQDEFGKIFGIVKSTVSLYESGKSTPNDEMKLKICRYFNVTADYLLGISPKEPSAAGSDPKYSDCLERIVSNCLKLNETGQNYIEAQTEFALQQDKYLKDVDIKKES